MQEVAIESRIAGCSADEIYRRLCDFQAYERHTPAVRKVVIEESDQRRSVSSWEVNFREGILKWREEDRFDDQNWTIRFRQIEGDAEFFLGSWSVQEDGDAARVSFRAYLDMGIPSLREVIEPIASRGLHENIRSILEGLFGEGLRCFEARAADVSPDSVLSSLEEE